LELPVLDLKQWTPQQVLVRFGPKRRAKHQTSGRESA
jgi:hypothetical protein